MKKLNNLSWTEIGSNLYQPWITIRVALEILRMNLTLSYFLSLTLKLASNQLKLMPRQPQQAWGNPDKVLLENKFGWDNTCHMTIKVFRIISTTAMCKCTIITLLDDSNLNAFQTFWQRLNILRLVDFPQIVDNCNFCLADSRASLSNLSFN